MSREVLGRQYLMSFGHGVVPAGDGPPDGDTGALFEAGNLAARIDAVAQAAVSDMPRSGRAHRGLGLDRQGREHLRTAMKAWAGAGSLDHAAFRVRFVSPMASDAAIENLRAAAEGARVATGHAALADAAAQLAGAMRGIGVDCWPGFLNDAALRADARIAAARPIVLARAATSMTATDANLTRSGPYIAENPRQWIGRPPVGDGACVALARAASDAAPSQFWRQGDKVQGDPGIQAGTIIATFDRNGHHTGHAAIYLGQDRKGIQVIDQRNCQDEIENMPGQNPPGKRTIRFGETRASLVDRGESYYVIE